MIAQAIKKYARRRVVDVIRRVVVGDGEAVAARLRATQGGSQTAVINTAYIERLQATFRSRLAGLIRRSRAGKAEENARGGDVLGGHLLQLLLQVAREAAEVAGGGSACGLTTVEWGTTGRTLVQLKSL